MSDNNMSNNLIMFCIFHKHCYIRNDTSYFTFFGVNETYAKTIHDTINITNNKVILEYNLKIYNPFLQKRGYMETSAYLHVYWNKLYEGKKMVGFSQYDMKHIHTYENLNTNTIYLLNAGQPIVYSGAWNPMMCPHLRDLDFLIHSYNMFFSKSYSLLQLENMPLSLWQTNIYPVEIYEKLCSWLEVLVEDIYPWSNLPPYETHFGSIGGYTERALSIFNAFQIYEGTPYANLSIQHGIGACEKEQYNTKSFLNNYSQDIHTQFIEDITCKDTDSIQYSMFKAQYYFEGVSYNCERVYKTNHTTGLFCSDSTGFFTECGFDISAQDPRLVEVNGIVYIVFICISPYDNQNWCVAISSFYEWKPFFLQIDNIPPNNIEKNWAPFAKDGQLYFVYNYDPLVILHYDFNPNGNCTIVFAQDGIMLPINTSNTYLRGGSNLIHYKDGFYIGGCHSRIYKDCYEHYTHIVLLDTNSWKLVYVSKPVMYLYNELRDKLFNSWWLSCSPSSRALCLLHNILVDKTPNIIQDPVSFYLKDNVYYITINVRDSVSLLYQISFANLFDFVQYDKPTGYYDNYTKETIMYM